MNFQIVCYNLLKLDKFISLGCSLWSHHLWLTWLPLHNDGWGLLLWLEAAALHAVAAADGNADGDDDWRQDPEQQEGSGSGSGSFDLSIRGAPINGIEIAKGSLKFSISLINIFLGLELSGSHEEGSANHEELNFIHSK